MKGSLLFVLFWTAAVTGVRAQQTVSDSSQMKMKHKISTAIGLSAGSSAIAGVDVAIHVIPRLTVRVGYNYLDHTFADVTQYLALPALNPIKSKIKTEAAIAQSNVALLADFHLNKKGSIRATLGVNYAFKNTYSGKLAYGQAESYGEVTIQPEDIGYLKATISTKSKINPYIGLGFGRLVPKKRVGLSLDLGTYYRGSPVVTIDATQLLRGNKENEVPLNRNLAPYKWYPIGTLRLAVKLN